MAIRRGVILVYTLAGCVAAVAGTPDPYKRLTMAGGFFLLAYVYAELTRVNR